MDVLKRRLIGRIDSAIAALDHAVEFLDFDDSKSEVCLPKRFVDHFLPLNLDDEAFLNAACAKVLAQYITSLCNNSDFELQHRPPESLLETVESQAVVESDCFDILTRALTRCLVDGNLCCDFDIEHCGLEISFDLSRHRCTNFRPCIKALQFLSDVKASESDFRLVIYLQSHGEQVLHKCCNSCLTASPLLIQSHAKYIWNHLSISGDPKELDFVHLNCSEPWIVYWAVHSLTLLGENPQAYKTPCWDRKCGGFGGGRGQIAHLATTYAAVAVYKMLHCTNLLDKGLIYGFLSTMKQHDGEFEMHAYGECDVRGIYCAIATAKMLNVLDEHLTKNVVEYIYKCQSYDGGFAGQPNLESHAGYTYCAIATLGMLNELKSEKLEKTKLWCLKRQTAQFGFQGRTHKLVDVCDSFWVGASLEILEAGCLVDSLAGKLLNVYIAMTCQMHQGFRDKPKVPPDLYHTCYALSALEIIGALSRADDKLKSSRLQHPATHNVLYNLLLEDGYDYDSSFW